MRKFLTPEACQTLVHGLVHSHLDYCNALLHGVPTYLLNRYQRIQNYGARLVYRVDRFTPSKPLLFNLHWLPVTYRKKIKICVFVFKALNNLAPSYISDMLQVRNSAYSLRSDAHNSINLLVPRTNKKSFGDRSFYSCAPKLWNQLPASVRLSDCLATFKKSLKTFYFRQAFSDFV